MMKSKRKTKQAGEDKTELSQIKPRFNQYKHLNNTLNIIIFLLNMLIYYNNLTHIAINM